MYAGHAVSCFLLRQMEFDADRYEARGVSGSETFAQTCRLLPQLSVASDGAFFRPCPCVERAEIVRRTFPR